jgi:hypothetical protein
MERYGAHAGPHRSRPRPTAEEWAGVAVHCVDVTPAEAPHHDDAIVRACVDIGPILPSDVRVDMRCEGLDAPIRLFSTHPHGEGRFAFEGHLPTRLLDGARTLTVSVWPGGRTGAEAQRALTPLSRTTIPTPRADPRGRP